MGSQSIVSLPYGQTACVSGLWVFGLGTGDAPIKAMDVTTKRIGNLDLDISWKGTGNGYVVEWGYAPDKLYS